MWNPNVPETTARLQAPERITPFMIGNLGKEHNKMYFRGRIRSVRISAGERYHEQFAPDDDFTSDVSTSANRALLTYDASQVDDAGHIADISGNRNHGYWQGTATDDWQPASPEEAAVAGMILDLGGEVEILDASGRRRVLEVEELPTAPFYVTEVKVLSIGDLKDDHVHKLSDLQRLESVYLAATGITDDSLKVLGAISTLRRIGVGSTKVTDDGIARLTELPRLTYLHVANTNVVTIHQRRLTRFQFPRSVCFLLFKEVLGHLCECSFRVGVSTFLRPQPQSQIHRSGAAFENTT